MKRALFRTFGKFDRARPTRGVVIVDRASETFGVRPLRSRRVYLLPLSTVAELVVSRIVKAEVAEKRAARSAKRGRT